MNTNLKPCPFCGKGADVLESIFHQETHRTCFAVFCYKCEIEGPPRKSKSRAVRAWNRRFVLTPEPEKKRRGDIK